MRELEMKSQARLRETGYMREGNTETDPVRESEGGGCLCRRMPSHFEGGRTAGENGPWELVPPKYLELRSGGQEGGVWG